MYRRMLCALALPAVAGCAVPAPFRRSDPRPPSARPAEMTLATRIRQEGWMTRFWEQLTPGQRRRVLSRLRRGEPPLAETETEAAPVWDAMGLPDRNALIFGAGPRRPAT